MAQKLVGQNYTTPDLHAKVTGRARYSEDFRTEGMLFAKLLVSPWPHARVTRIDTSAAEAMPGVKAILTADDLPKVAEGANLGEGIIASTVSERGLTMEPLYVGEPILAVAAVDELTATEAIEAIQVEYEPLPFVVDPIEALRPGGPSARTNGNVWARPDADEGPSGPVVREIKWTKADFDEAGDRKLPFGQTKDEWQVGDVEAALAQADLVLDETFVGPNTSHQPLETRTAMAYWQNGKLYMHCSTQSTMRTIGAVARWVGIEPENVVIVAEYCGGGFGSKGSSTVFTVVPALLSKKTGTPVMMRVTREDEQWIGRARPALHSRVKIGFRRDGRIVALDGLAIVDNGPYDIVGDGRSAGDHISLSYQPMAMRWRSINVLTNTPPRGAQRAPGGMQGNSLMAPILAKAAHALGISQMAIHRINAPEEGKPEYGGPNGRGVRSRATSCFLRQAIDRGTALFNYEARVAQNGQRTGSKVRGVGMAVSAYSAGSIGFDGLIVIKPDGHLQVQSGIGNLGTESTFDVHRVAAELIGVPWEKVEVVWGDTAKHLPNTCGQGGSQTAHAMSRAAHAAGMDAVRKLQQIAARDLGGRPEDYVVEDERVARRGGAGMSLARAAQRAIELGGAFDGHEPPEDVNNETKSAAAALAGMGLMGVARDNYGRDGTSKSYVASFAEVEVDVETGHYRILDVLAVADVGTVLHPHSLNGQILGGVMLGLGHAYGQKWVYDQHYGVPLARRFYHTKPPSILDAPSTMAAVALDIADPETPVGTRGVGESPVGSGFGAVVNALIAAVGPDVFNRAPVTSDMILTALEAGGPTHAPLQANV